MFLKNSSCVLSKFAMCGLDLRALRRRANYFEPKKQLVLRRLVAWSVFLRPVSAQTQESAWPKWSNGPECRSSQLQQPRVVWCVWLWLQPHTHSFLVCTHYYLLWEAHAPTCGPRWTLFWWRSVLFISARYTHKQEVRDTFISLSDCLAHNQRRMNPESGKEWRCVFTMIHSVSIVNVCAGRINYPERWGF